MRIASFLRRFIPIVLLNTFVWALVNLYVPTPYMDEEFHVGQTSNYLEGEFLKWDPKITTFPGLYIFTSILVFPYIFLVRSGVISRDIVIPRVAIYRYANIILGSALFPLYADIIHLQYKHQRSGRVHMKAFILTLFPLSYFFNFMYYTDVGSLFFIVLSMYLVLNKNTKIAALAGIAAVAFRQTNVVWVGFIMLLAILREYSRSAWKGQTLSIAKIKAVLRFYVRTFPKWILFTLIFVGFVGFVIWNGGSMVLGDKDHHAVSLHLAQICYFAAASFFLFLPLIAGDPVKYAMTFYKYKNEYLRYIIPFIVISVAFFSEAHPFLLSDNRHYVFYIWKDIINRTWYSKYLLVPVYVLGINAVMFAADQVAYLGKMLKYAYFACVAAVLIPAPLLELRYFIVPMVILNLFYVEAPIVMLAYLCLFLALNGMNIYFFMFMSLGTFKDIRFMI